MKTPETKLLTRIEIKGDFDKYEIFQDNNNKFIIQSINGYSNECTGGHRTLISAIQHVYQMIRTEYEDRCMERPDPTKMSPADRRNHWETTPQEQYVRRKDGTFSNITTY